LKINGILFFHLFYIEDVPVLFIPGTSITFDPFYFDVKRNENEREGKRREAELTERKVGIGFLVYKTFTQRCISVMPNYGQFVLFDLRIIPVHLYLFKYQQINHLRIV